MKAKFCQSCGIQMTSADQYGSNADGSPNEEYCNCCYQDGAFTKDCTMDDMIDHWLQFLDKLDKDMIHPNTKEKARSEMKKSFPMLKRWKV